MVGFALFLGSQTNVPQMPGRDAYNVQGRNLVQNHGGFCNKLLCTVEAEDQRGLVLSIIFFME